MLDSFSGNLHAVGRGSIEDLCAAASEHSSLWMLTDCFL